MAKTPAERQRERRERLKAMQPPPVDLTTPHLRRSFSEWLDAGGPDREEDGPHGIVTPPSVSYGVDEQLETIGVRLDWGTVEKAERAIEVFIDAAQAMAELVSAYKWGEIKRAQSAIADNTAGNSEAINAALIEFERLGDIRRGLQQKTRRDFAVTVVKAGR